MEAALAAAAGVTNGLRDGCRTGGPGAAKAAPASAAPSRALEPWRPDRRPGAGWQRRVQNLPCWDDPRLATWWARRSSRGSR